MPNLKAKEPVEDYKLTKEQKAFYQVYNRITKVGAMIKRGINFQTSKLQALQQIAQELDGQKKELMLKAPDQSVLEAADEGMIESGGGRN